MPVSLRAPVGWRREGYIPCWWGHCPSHSGCVTLGRKLHQGNPGLCPPGSLCSWRPVCLPKQIIWKRSSSLCPPSGSDPPTGRGFHTPVTWACSPRHPRPEYTGHNTHVQACISGSPTLTPSVRGDGHCSSSGEDEGLRGPELWCPGCQRWESRETVGELSTQALVGSQQVRAALNFKGWAVAFKTRRDLY